ncbi:MAG: hypothetical protein B7Y91_01175 [Rhodobacterales bacterium 32-64-14]|nr:MAG: hypothetical protein B7Y91_01175 [Rhodobacterales bacterium 32-64-14]
MLALVAFASLSACQPAAPPAAETAPAAEAPAPAGPDAPVETASWDIYVTPVLALTWGSDGLSISCEEAKGVLRLSFEPAWEKDGPFDKAVVHFGDKSFPVTIDTSAAAGALDRNRPHYVLPANADRHVRHDLRPDQRTPLAAPRRSFENMTPGEGEQGSRRAGSDLFAAEDNPQELSWPTPPS